MFRILISNTRCGRLVGNRCSTVWTRSVSTNMSCMTHRRSDDRTVTQCDFNSKNTSRILTIPNLMTTARILATPFIGHCIVNNHHTTAVVLFSAAAITDLLDGYIARNFENQKSVLGSLLDPAADKLLICTMFACLTYVELISWTITLIVFGRDLLLLTGAAVLRYRSLSTPRSFAKFFNPSETTFEVHPTLLSKVNTTFQLVLVASVITGSAFTSLHSPSFIDVLSLLTAATTITSGLQYAFSSNAIRSVSSSK